jgi:hypothetical protein
LAKGTNHAANEKHQPAPPVLVTSSQGVGEVETEKPVVHDWREQMSAENKMRVANMTDEEREAEKQEILKRFGTDIGDVLLRSRQARDKNVQDRRPTLGAKTRMTSSPAKFDVEQPFKELPEGMIFL